MSKLKEIREKLYITNEYGVEHQNPDARLDPEDVEYMKQEYGIRTDVHRSCVNCQVRQITKYRNAKGLGDTSKFRIDCKGIPKALPQGSAAALRKMTTAGDMDPERAKLLLMSTVDPVAWATLMFGFDEADPTWHLRSYQKEQLRCTSPRMVIREGRRSGKTFVVALKLLYLVFNRQVSRGVYPLGHPQEGETIQSGPGVMIVTPFQSQLENIFDEMEALLKRNPDLAARVSSGTGASLYTKTPYFSMSFDNDGIINGFVSGVAIKADGSGGGTMRGRNAHIIYVDEADMVPEATLAKVVIPVLLTDPLGEVTFIATSTPIGKRGPFYNWCKKSPDWKEDHLPSTVLPQWEKNKALYEQEGNEESFRTEYMAQFIDSSFGVFKPSYVYDSLKDYTYSDCRDATWWRKYANVHKPEELIFCIGIDWNKNAGTEYVVVAYHSSTHKFWVVESVNLSATEFSSIRWKEEVVRLNYKWKPQYIYADEGYGHTIIEDLKLLSMKFAAGEKKTLRDVETAKLKDRLTAFNFSSKVELHDPLGGEKKSKYAKDFLVEFTLRVLEDGILCMPHEEETLRKQLLNYVVLRRSKGTNRPVYGASNHNIGDHRLDALMLALGGIQLENGMYSAKSLAHSRPAFLGKGKLDARSAAQEMTPGSDLLHSASKQSAAAPMKLSLLQSLRSGETPQQALARNSNNSARVTKRSRGKMNSEGNSVEEYFKKNASDYRGYENDTEDQYRKTDTRTSRVASRRRRGGRRGRSIKRRK